MKLPFDFSLKSAFRILLPGFVLGIAMLPILKTVSDRINEGKYIEYIFVTFIIIAGWLMVISDMSIYMVYEGRRYWPRRLWNAMKNLEMKRLKRLSEKIAKYKQTNREKYLEASVEIRRFPMDENGQYCARYPTRFGNLLAAYEDYPDRIYGMDAPFYWPRIWVKLDKDLREEIDNQQAVADSAIYTSSALFFGGAMCVIYAVIMKTKLFSIKYLPGFESLLLLSLLAVITGYGLYRGSLHVHAQFGELFKSIFDIYRSNVTFNDIVGEVSEIINDPSIKKLSYKDQNKIVWRYLHNYRVKLSKDGPAVPPTETRKQIRAKKM